MYRIVFEQLLECPLELAGEAKAQYYSSIYLEKVYFELRNYEVAQVANKFT